jgi:hypothetical protein
MLGQIHSPGDGHALRGRGLGTSGVEGRLGCVFQADLEALRDGRPGQGRPRSRSASLIRRA